MRPKRQSGFTLIELLISTVIAVVLGISLIAVVLANRKQADVDIAIAECSSIAAAADHNQRLVQSTTVDASGAYHYTWNDQATFANVTTLNAAIGGTLPTSSPWSTAYQWMATGGLAAQCQFVIPTGTSVTVSPRFGLATAAVAGGTQVTVMALASNKSIVVQYPRGVKSSLYMEQIR